MEGTTLAQKLCAEHYDNQDCDTFARWAADRSLLDEIEQVKNACVLTDKHNAELAERLPVAAVVETEKSLCAFVQVVAANRHITDALNALAI